MARQTVTASNQSSLYSRQSQSHVFQMINWATRGKQTSVYYTTTNSLFRYLFTHTPKIQSHLIPGYFLLKRSKAISFQDIFARPWCPTTRSEKTSFLCLLLKIATDTTTMNEEFRTLSYYFVMYSLRNVFTLSASPIKWTLWKLKLKPNYE